MTPPETALEGPETRIAMIRAGKGCRDAPDPQIGARITGFLRVSSWERIERELAELALESLETAAADPTPEADAPEVEEAPAAGSAADAPRETITLDPGERCPDCGGALRLVGRISPSSRWATSSATR